MPVAHTNPARYSAMFNTPVISGFAEVEIVEDITSAFVRVRTVGTYDVCHSEAPVKLEMTMRRDALLPLAAL